MNNTRSWTGIAALALALTLPACGDFLGVNEDPNAPEHARVDLTLPAVIAAFGHSVIGGSQAQWGTEWTQQYSYNRTNRSYPDNQIHRYMMSAVAAGYPWDITYANVLKEARNVMRETEPTEDWAYHGIAKFIYAWTFAHVTDMWGPAPYTQALDTNFPDPVYDDQQTIYAAVHTLLEESIADMQRTTARLPGTNDLLYAGDMTKWVKLARTVQARLHLRLAYAPGESATGRAQQALDALAQGFISNDDDADFAYPGGEDGWRQPWWNLEDLDGYRISQYYLDLLQGLSDPRLPITVRPAAFDSVRGTIVYRAHTNGAPGENDSTISRIGDYFLADSADLRWISYAEAKFIEAEARLIVSGAAAADAPYRDGIRANMEKMGVATVDIDTYVNARVNLGGVANPLEEIIMQKYIANYLNGEVWADWRRTGYPVLELVEERVIDGIPQRLRAPISEVSYNSHNLAATGIDPGLEGMLVRVWWASGTQ